MTCHHLSPLAVLCAATLLATAPPAVVAAGIAAKAPPSPDQPQPRTGRYRIVKRGAHLIHARCLEGGHVLVPTHEKATAAERDHDIRDACKTVDYSK
jgi:hypothetical protein